MDHIPLIHRAAAFADRLAIVASEGRFTYRQLLDASASAATVLLGDQVDLAEARVAFLVPSEFEYAATQWGIWRAGGIAVPLAVMHPPAELVYTIEDSQASIVVAHREFAEVARPLAESRGLRFLRSDELLAADAKPLPDVMPNHRAMILYTSGTTGKPKGVVTTHLNIAAQIEMLVKSWEWTADDHILNFLPLHHIHGIVNVLSCALWSGATCEMLPKFDATAVWNRIASNKPLTLFMAVPTIYSKLISTWKAASPQQQEIWSNSCRRLRLMVSGSAALPVAVLEEWQRISGHVLLERYGMTEIGMALSNPLHGQRRPGCVGFPLPTVNARLVDETQNAVPDDVPGEIQIGGPAVFQEYWNRPDATRDAFTADGWFRTGDVATRHAGVYRILGRNSVDIIKSGGYKISALEIEDVLLTHPAIQQAAVVGVADPEWGERVCAAVVLQPNQVVELAALRTWAKDRLAPYKIPTRLLCVPELSRNAMGKVIKPAVAKLFDSQ